MRVCLHVKSCEVSMCVSVFRNLSEHSIVSKLFYAHAALIYSIHIQFDFYPNKRNVPRNFARQINCCAKFRLPKRNATGNFARLHEISMNYGNNRCIEMSTKIRFLRNKSHNFGKFRRNSPSLLLHNTVKLHVPAR